MTDDTAISTSAPGPASTDEQPPLELVERLRAQAADLEDRWRRAVADTDNVRKQSARDIERRILDERAQVASNWLPVVDNLERALEHAESSPENLLSGVRSVLEMAYDVLARLGYPRRDDLGGRFDPALHEAVAVRADDSKAPGTIVRVVQGGYGDADKQLRPASVVVTARST